jgi:hypothetical protein
LNNPTPYSEVNAVLHSLLANVQAILGDQFVALYLYGSLSSGDFDPATSDIDFCVVTQGEVPAALIPALEAMHMNYATSEDYWAHKLEGAYIPQAALRRYTPGEPPRPTINEGKFYLAGQGSDWIIQRHIMRESGVVLAGPEPRDLIDPVSPEEIRASVAGVLREWWEPLIQKPDWIDNPLYQSYAVLTMARALYTFEMGTVASKPKSAQWAQQTFPHYADLIARAAAWKPGMPFDRLDETLDLIRYTVERSKIVE